MTTLESRIRESRLEQGISASELARAVGVTSAAVSRWENGLVKNLRMEHLFSIARLLDLNAEWLATGNGERRHTSRADNRLAESHAEYNTMTNDERIWLNIYRRLSPDCRKNIYEAFDKGFQK